MNKYIKNGSLLLLALITALSGCNKTGNMDSTSPISDNGGNNDINYEHIGGDETNDEKIKYATGGVFAIDSMQLNEEETLKFITNPQKLPTATARTTTTTIYKVDIDSFHTANYYKKNGVECILYTPDFYFSHTTATNEYEEVVAIYNEQKEKYVVTEIHTEGNAYIPLNGVVFAIPKQNEDKGITMTNPFTIGDEIPFNQTSSINRYEHALLNQEDIRMVFQDENVYREAGKVVLYNREYGQFTKTNRYGAEIYFKYDFEKHSYVVSGFKGDLKEVNNLVDNHMEYGSKIPDYGFVISAQNACVGYQAYRQGRKYNIGDTINIENYTIYTNENNTTFTKYPTDNPGSRPYGYIAKFDEEAMILDEYGYTNLGLYEAVELAVVEVGSYGLVTKIDREVGCPKNGYILSCNGEIGKQLKEVVHVGSIIKIDGSKIHVIDEIGLSELVALEYYGDQVNTKYEEGINKLYDYDYNTLKAKVDSIKEAQITIKNLKDEIDATNDETLIRDNSIKIHQEYVDAMIDYQYAYVSANESPYVDGRAAWLWATNCNSLQEVKDLVKHYYDSNINLIYLCVFDFGFTYFQSDIVPYCPTFKGDYGEYGQDNFLGAFIGEAHKLGIEVHGWSTNFYVGDTSRTNNDLFNAHPEWQQVYYTGKVDSDDEMTEQTLLYFDQANPEVHNFLISFYNELLEENDLDGFHIDYIRYAAGNDLVSDGNVYCPVSALSSTLQVNECLNRSTGYTEYAMNDFKNTYGYPSSADVKELVKSKTIYKLWSEYRTNKVTEYMEKVYEQVIVPNDTMFSMAIVPEVEFAKANKMQDWTKWIENGWLDGINGMYYSSDPNRTLIEHQKVHDILTDKVYNYPGVLAASYFSLPAIENIYYYQAAHQSSNMGASFFDANAIWSHQRIIYSNSNPDLETLITNGTHRYDAVLPHNDLKTIMEAFINDISDRADRLYIPEEGMNNSQKEALIKELKSVSKTNPEDAIESLTSIQNLLSQYGNQSVQDRISEYIDLMISLCKIKIERSK